jgi:phosphatidylglycerophosphate synthase
MPPEARAATLLIPIEPPWDQRLARAAVRPLRATAVTPNQVTTLSLAMGLLAALLYAKSGFAAHLGAVCFVLSFWLDHVDGELARTTGRMTLFGHYYDLAADGAVLVALFVGIGIGLRDSALGPWSIGLGIAAGLGAAVIIVLRMQLEQRAGKAAVRQPNLLGFQIEDVMYLVGPITWLNLLPPFLVLAGIGAPLSALLVLWQCRRVPIERAR